MTMTSTTARAGYFDVVLSDTPRPHPDPGCGRAFVTRQFRLMSCSASAASRFSMPVTAPARSLWLCS